MFWKHDSKNDVTMLYGFTRVKPSFDAVVTLYRMGDVTLVDGFLSSVKLTQQDYINLFNYVKSTVKTEYLIFEVVKGSARLYRRTFRKLNFKIEEEKPGVTFDGYDSLLIKIRL